MILRRRRRLRGLGPLQEAGGRLAELAAEAGIRRVPRVERGPVSQHDAVSYGAPGRPRVVLPPAVAVRWRDRELFDPLVWHELAHIRHRDVALAWLARSVWVRAGASPDPAAGGVAAVQRPFPSWLTSCGGQPCWG